ncbi:MAG: DUF5606 domain-containing protein [Cyclobacteriaceae bacterium]|nr:DUF5606 domain-containing protein [Cyclobacteriaceae bacterium]MCX7636767.1 DUF5606 domain-containing protein [Cyclobacteriaceae bacterium]MDW8330662.1 DUF5606 domain-containing protein [Cyclobacteriaceae bacterium]
MELKDIATVSGKSGLFRVLSAGKGGMVLEAIDTKARVVLPISQKVSVLSEISIYTTTQEGTVPLEKVLKKIHSDYGNDMGLDHSAEPSELHAFMKSVLPEYDSDRVYTSDIKKLVRWYQLLLQYAPEVLKEDQ